MSSALFVLAMIVTADPAPPAEKAATDKTEAATPAAEPTKTVAMPDDIPRDSEGRPAVYEGFGVWTSANTFPIGIDFSYASIYAFASWNPWVSIFTVFKLWTFAGGVGYTFRLTKSKTDRDVFLLDITALLHGGGWTGDINLFSSGTSGAGYFAPGVGIGIRYQRSDGIFAGLRLPLMGVLVAPQIPGASPGLLIAGFFAVALLTDPFIYLGYRF